VTPLVFHYNDFAKNETVSLFSTAIFDTLFVDYSFDKVNYKRLTFRETGQPLLYEARFPLRRSIIYYRIEAFVSENRVLYQDSIEVDKRHTGKHF
jgi:hypothetical protein